MHYSKMWSDQNIYKVVGINVRKIYIAAKYKLTTGMTYKSMCIFVTFRHRHAKFELDTTKSLAFTAVYIQKDRHRRQFAIL